MYREGRERGRQGFWKGVRGPRSDNAFQGSHCHWRLTSVRAKVYFDMDGGENDRKGEVEKERKGELLCREEVILTPHRNRGRHLRGRKKRGG